MTQEEFITLDDFLKSEKSWNEILAKARIVPEWFVEFFDHPDAHEALLTLLQTFDEERFSELLEVIHGPIVLPEEEKQHIKLLDTPAIAKKHEAEYALREALLSSLPPRLLTFRDRFQALAPVDDNVFESLLAELDAATVLNIGLSSAKHTSSNPPPPPPGISQSEHADEQSRLTFYHKLVKYGITPISIYQTTECISKAIRNAMSEASLKDATKVSIIYQQGRYYIDLAPQLDLTKAIHSTCNHSRKHASCLINWLIDVAHWKPFLFRSLKTEPVDLGGKKGITVSLIDDLEEDLYDQWRSTRRLKPEDIARHKKEIKQLAHAGSNEDSLITKSHEVGQQVLFSGENYGHP